MDNFEVPYLPISEFDVTKVVKEFSNLENEESNNYEFDVMESTGKDLPEEVTLILVGMGMEKYIELFNKMNIDLDSFLNLKESELEEIGITDANDRQIIAENLKVHHESRENFIVTENHIEDLSIVRNVSCQLLLLQNYCAYVELQMRKQNLIDYAIDEEDTACTFLKAFAECALTQSSIMISRIYDENNSENLVDKLLKTYNLTLTKGLQGYLPKKKRREKYFLKFMVLIGFSSLVVLTGKYLMRRS